MKKQFLALLCVFAINCTAIAANDIKTRLKTMNDERERVYKLKGSGESYFLENCPNHLSFWQQTAEQGEEIAQFLLAGCYYYGSGVTKDEIQAFNWNNKAAEQGNADAQANLGVMYRNGLGVTKDDTQAVFWYQKAAKQGNTMAQSHLGYAYGNGIGVPHDDIQAVFWYRKAAEQGNANGQQNLGVMYRDGKGVTKDDMQAVYWFRKAAEQGNEYAQINLGNAYDQGHGIAQDATQAVYWFRKAAELGNSDAQTNLGISYRDGDGVTKDDTQAVYWFRKAAAQGNVMAQKELENRDLIKATEQKQQADQAALRHSQGYMAIISCRRAGNEKGEPFFCFNSYDFQSSLKITKGNFSKVYTAHTLKEAGQIYDNELHIQLPVHFKLVAQNSEHWAILSVKVINSKGDAVFEDQADFLGVIAVEN